MSNVNKRLIEYAQSFSGVNTDDAQKTVYQQVRENRQSDFRTELITIDGKKYQIEFDKEKSPAAWGVERMSYLRGKEIAQKIGLAVVTSREWTALSALLQSKDAVLEKTLWTGLSEITDTIVDYDNGRVIERPVIDVKSGVMKKDFFGVSVKAANVWKTKIPKGVEGYIGDIEGYDEFFDILFGCKNVRKKIGESAYIWTAKKGVKVVARANGVGDEGRDDAEERHSIDATIDLEQEAEEKDLFGVRLCCVRCLDE